MPFPCTGFSDIFDVDRFIKYLAKDVSIVKEFPLRRGQIWAPYRMRVHRKCTDRCYINYVFPVLNKKHVVQITKFDYRLANSLDTDLQKLRCRVNYHALKFADPILRMGEKLVQRMRMRSKHFIALHLRTVTQIRQGGMEDALTPEEVGLMLRSLGYGEDVHIYVASGEIYGGEETLAPLKALFPK